MRSLFNPGLVCLVILAAALGGCSKETSDRSLVFLGPSEGQQIVGEPRRNLLGLGGEQTGVWVDPRSEADYLAGHIPGAISIPLKLIATEHERLKSYGVIIVYGDDYRDPVAEGMSKKLLQLGYRDVRTLRGGLRAWKDAGYGLETGSGGN
ncbi:MAG: hypothetical protein JSV91_04755 [Phycisphaerales bacterium]|nr:MAG: hypothetical protein JSV91_04755 [Phycisphaerales bacterium]